MTLIYSALMLVGVAFVLLQLQAFDGLLVINPGTSEQVLVRAAGEGYSLAATHRALTPDLIPFSHPQTFQEHLDPDTKYDVVEFPFTVYLKESEILETFPPREVIEIYGAAGTIAHTVQAGDSLETEEGTLRIEAIRPWKGLVRHVQGEPMANVSVALGEDRWLENLFLGGKAWLYLDRRIAVRFGWFDDEASARAAMPEKLPGLESARWGVRDGERMQWIENFAPGMGVILEDDTALMLLRAEMAHEALGVIGPAIQLRMINAQGQKDFWLRPNGNLKEEEAIFDYPAGHEIVVYLHAWREDNAVATVFHQGTVLETEVLTAQQTWQPSTENPFALRLEQCLHNALQASESTQEVWEAVVEGPEGRARLRQGLRLRAGELQLSYRRIPVPPRLTSHFEIQEPDSDTTTPFTLAPGESIQYENWRFTLLDFPDPLKPDTAQLQVQRLGTSISKLGVLLLIGGGVGLLFLLFRPNQENQPRMNTDEHG